MSRRFSALNAINANTGIIPVLGAPQYITNEVEVGDVEDYGHHEAGEFWVEDPEGAHLAITRALGLPEYELYRDESPELYKTSPLTDEEIELMNKYVAISKEKDHHPGQKIWEKLRYARYACWSMFNEWIETVWMPFTVFQDKVERRTNVLRSKGKEPTEEQWHQVRLQLQKLQASCQKEYINQEGEWKVDFRGVQGPTRATQLNQFTWASYQKAQEATERCREFWVSTLGMALSDLNWDRSECWKEIEKKGLHQKWWEYNKLRNETVKDEWWVCGEIDEAINNPMVQKGVNVISDYLLGGDRRNDIDPSLWYQLDGLPTEDWYFVCQCAPPGLLFASEERSHLKFMLSCFEDKKKVERIKMEKVKKQKKVDWYDEEEKLYQESLKVLLMMQ